ncbi:MAG: 4Fe-4S dicluster domain-containing protein [Pseudomonadota bacterium]
MATEQMDRRAFFRRGLDKAAKAAVKHADARVSRYAKHWIRPPFALAELEFLLACTRCDDCIDACPHQLIFPLPARLGAQVVGTPALDLLNKGCQLCEDWPCVAACEPGALKRPAEQDESGIEPPRLAFAWIDTQRCLPYSGPECGACAASCSVPGAMVWEGERPRIDPDLCVGCALCREHCIVEPKAVEIRSLHGQTDKTYKNDN